ncbi:hypothetical protein [Bacillus sp. AFS096315]|uniref:hypothetical protein n=1 Tax=Bacillus sp. AFS096315 TaxID=2033517 RepID=UPI000BEE4173|nr:hypothetical protein [Bacillus sp. AFS096315]PEC46382.1 hypothetical protein CON00_23970 [Bacillus sp. AFS096315]
MDSQGFGIMHSSIILKNLQGMSGFNFEEHARFLLMLTTPNFVPTRLRKDGGIDGMIRKQVQKEKQIQILIDIYSMYGKESSTTKPDISKIKGDFNKAIDYASKKGYTFKQWNLVINFELDTTLLNHLTDCCDEQGVIFNQITPTKLLSMVHSKERLFEAACFFNAVEMPPMLKYSDLSYHKLAERALLDLTNKNKSITEKFKMLSEINSTILKFSFIDKKANILYYTSEIGRQTRIHESFCADYKFIEGQFLPSEPREGFQFPFYKNDENNYVISIKNLNPIYKLCLHLQKQLESTGDYNVLVALEVFQVHYNRFLSKSDLKAN